MNSDTMQDSAAYSLVWNASALNREQIDAFIDCGIYVKTMLWSSYDEEYDRRWLESLIILAGWLYVLIPVPDADSEPFMHEQRKRVEQLFANACALRDEDDSEDEGEI